LTYINISEIKNHYKTTLSSNKQTAK
jgi:hypothetical protein